MAAISPAPRGFSSPAFLYRLLPTITVLIALSIYLIISENIYVTRLKGKSGDKFKSYSQNNEVQSALPASINSMKQDIHDMLDQMMEQIAALAVSSQPNEMGSGLRGAFEIDTSVQNFPDPITTNDNCPPVYSAVEIGTSNFDTLIQATEKSDPHATGLSADAMKIYINQLPDLSCWKKVATAVVGKSNDVPSSGTILTYYIDPADIAKYNMPDWLRGCNSVGKPHATGLAYLQEKNLVHLLHNISVPVVSVEQLLNNNSVCRMKRLKVDVEGFDGDLLIAFSEWVDKNHGVCYADMVTGEFNELSYGRVSGADASTALARVGYKLLDTKEGFHWMWEYVGNVPISTTANLTKPSSSEAFSIKESSSQCMRDRELHPVPDRESLISVKPKQDLASIRMARDSMNIHLKHLNESSAVQMVRGLPFEQKCVRSPTPKKFHYIWVGSELPEKYIFNIMDMALMNPGWEVFLWFEYESKLLFDRLKQNGVQYKFKNVTKYIEEGLFVNGDLISKEANMAGKSDYIRYEAVYLEGGIYTDTDSHPVRPYDDFSNIYRWAFVTFDLAEEGYGNLSNAAFGFEQGSRLLEFAIKLARENCLKHNLCGVMSGAGPDFFTAAVSYFDDPDVVFVHKQNLLFNPPTNQSVTFQTNDATWLCDGKICDGVKDLS